MALDASQFAFQDRVPLGQAEFGVRLQMAGQARLRVFARIDDESATSAAGGDMPAARAVAGLASRLALHQAVGCMQAGVRAGRKMPHIIGVTFIAGPVTDKGCSLDLRRHHHSAFNGRTGTDNQPDKRQHRPADEPPAKFRRANGKHGLKVTESAGSLQADSPDGTGNHLASTATRI